MKVGFIVEGFHDEEKLRNILPDSQFAVTKGTRFDNRVKMDIRSLLQSCDKVFILTDPDEEGDYLANLIWSVFPNIPRIHINPEEAKCYLKNKVKIGVEHCTEEYLLSVLKEHLTY